MGINGGGSTCFEGGVALGRILMMIYSRLKVIPSYNLDVELHTTSCHHHERFNTGSSGIGNNPFRKKLSMFKFCITKFYAH